MGRGSGSGICLPCNLRYVPQSSGFFICQMGILVFVFVVKNKLDNAKEESYFTKCKACTSAKD